MARTLRLAGGIGLAAFLVHALVSAGDGPDPLFDLWLYNGLQLLATVTLVLGGLRASGLERAGWLVLGAGVAAYTVGDIYYSLALSGDAAPPYPSLADVAYSAFYPASFAGLVLLFRARTGGLPGRSGWTAQSPRSAWPRSPWRSSSSTSSVGRRARPRLSQRTSSIRSVTRPCSVPSSASWC